jgi:hypothetical protein
MKYMKYIKTIIRLSILTIVTLCLNFLGKTNEAQAAANGLPVGKTSRVVNQVSALKEEDSRSLAQDDPVFALERITAALDSHGEILLNDNTHILVGPGAEVSLDDFVVSDGGIQSATIIVLKGAFRFVSGESPKGTFKIKTPLTTIGIRGTSFDIYVNDSGITDVILYSGLVNVCTLENRCRLLKRNCDIIRVTSKRNIGFRQFLRSRNKSSENRDYSLVADQQRFQEAWRAPITSCSRRAANRDLDERQDGSDPAPSNSGSRGNSSPGVTGGAYD